MSDLKWQSPTELVRRLKAGQRYQTQLEDEIRKYDWRVKG